MTWWKTGLLLAAGGAAGLALGVWLESEGKEERWDYEEEVERARIRGLKADGMKILVAKMKEEAAWALEECATDEERAGVYAEVEASIRKLQAILQKRGEKIIAELKEQAAQKQAEGAESDDAAVFQSFKRTMADMTESLDEALGSLKKEAEPTGV